METKEWWLSSRQITVYVKTEYDPVTRVDKIVDAAPVVKKFIGQSLTNPEELDDSPRRL